MAIALAEEIAGSDPASAARDAGLRYVHDDRPGISRLRTSSGFRYLDPDGGPIRSAADLDRIRRLAIPPAWTDVWICKAANGHIQATGRDARGRKQYRYHERWREVRDATKYDRVVHFGHALAAVRERVERDLALPGLPRDRVLAAVVRLLDETYIRVGSDEYARTNKSFGLTTLRCKHVDVVGTHIRFEFRGKSGVQHSVSIRNRRLAAIVKRCQELPGHELFQYLGNDGGRHSVDSNAVNDYIRDASGGDFTAKDFRTWGGTVLAARALQAAGPPESETAAKKTLIEAVDAVASSLGNTRAVCRRCYIHPAVIDGYMEGTLVAEFRAAATPRLAGSGGLLSDEEVGVLAFLESSG